MPLRRLRRLLALVALALAVCAAVPCSVLAGEDTCCGSAAGCGDASQAPCAQLAAKPCCEAPQIPLDLTFTPAVPAALAAVQADLKDREIICVLFDRHPKHVRIADSISIRTIVLRL